MGSLWRQRTRILATLPMALFGASTAGAMDFGAIRALQHGPIGDSPQYADIGEYEGEGAVVLSRSWGKYTINDDADSKVGGSYFKTKIQTGGGWSPSKNFTLTGMLDFTLASDFDEDQTRSDPHTRLDTGNYRHEFSLFGTFKANPIVAGGGLGVILIGSEERQFKYGDDKYRQDVASAAMPVLRLFGGISTKQVDATLGLRIFTMGDATVEAEKPGGDKEQYDIVRRSPGEVHADGRLKLQSVTLAAGVAYVLTGQASEQEDEFSVHFVKEGNATVRKMGGERRNTDQFKIGAGARFDPSKMIGVLGGLSYIASNYSSPELASLEHENIGGLRLDVGTDVKVQSFKGYFQVGYMIDSSVSYTVEGTNREAANVEQTQHQPLNDGDKIKMSQGSWTLALGGGVAL